MDSASSRLSIKAATLSMLFMVPSISGSIILGFLPGCCDAATRDRIPLRNNRKGRNWELIDKREEPSRELTQAWTVLWGCIWYGYPSSVSQLGGKCND